MTDELADRHPIIVYGLADVPLPLRAKLRPDSPLFRCCFYLAYVGPTVAAGLRRAFELLPEPPCDDVEEGMRIAQAIADALQQTTVGVLLFAMHSREEATSIKRGFHTGEAAPFRRALEQAGLTLIEGAEVFHDRLRFVASDAAFVKRATDGETLSFTEPHVVLASDADGAPQLSAIMTPPQSWDCSLIGVDGGVIDLRSISSDAAQPIRFGGDAPSRRATRTEADDLGELAPDRARGRLGHEEPGGAVGEAVMRSLVEYAVKLSTDQVIAVAHGWARYIVSDDVTGRMALFGDAFLIGLSAILGDAEIRRIIALELRAIAASRFRDGPST